MTFFQRTKTVLLVLTLVALALTPPEAQGSDRGATILFIGDLHSQLLPLSTKTHKTTVFSGGLVHAAEILRRERQAHPDALILQGGDAVSGPMWLHFFGKPEFSALERAGVQAGLLGNHEFDYGPEHLKKGLAETSVPMIASNLSFDDERLQRRVSKYVLLRAGDVSVGVFGLASLRLFSQASPGEGVHLESDVANVSRKMVRELHERGAEIIIALSRLCEEKNMALASSVEGIHAILGGYSHDKVGEDLFVTGPKGWKTLIAKAGAYGTFVGKLVVVADERGALKGQDTSWELLKVTPDVGSHREVEEIAHAFEERLNEALLATIGFFENQADGRADSLRGDENALANFISDALRWRLGTDIAMINGGGIRGDRIFPAGNVSWKLLSEILPFNNPTCIVSLTGEQIRQILEISAATVEGSADPYDPENSPPTGGFLHFSGLKAEYLLSKRPTRIDGDDRLLQWGDRLGQVFVLEEGGWEPLEEERTYTVAVNSWTAGGGDRFFVFPQGAVERTDILDIDAVADYLMARPNQTFRLAKDGRLSIRRD